MVARGTQADLPGDGGAERDGRDGSAGPDAEGGATVPGWTVVVPVKGGSAAKTRLGLPERQRSELALAMALDCLDAVRATPSVSSVLCVSDDPVVREAVLELGVVVVPAGGPGLDRAVVAGLAAAAGAPSAGPVAVLVADLPALRPVDLEHALRDATTGPGPVFVADADGTGSVLVADRDGAPPHRFGPGSAAAHRTAGARALSDPLPSLRRDVDTPAALTAAGTLGLGPRTAALRARTTPLPAPRRRPRSTTSADPHRDRPGPERVAAAVADLRPGTPPADVEALLAARGPELARVLAAAATVRDVALDRAGRPGVITYSRKVFLPITRLCRDRCHYCTFATTPNRVPSAFLSPADVLAVARAGAEMGCKEALFTLGDAPEDRWPAARAWLDRHGHASTLDYVAVLAELILAETGLLPHLNPGVLGAAALRDLRPLAPSMGMMLETTSRRLWSEPGQVHHGSPDKDPAVRLQVLADAAAAEVPFTTGILVGIGETLAERAATVLALRAAAAAGNVQEVIVQNFRAKDDTAMRGERDLDHQEYLAAIAVTRLVVDADVSVQAPPNLSDPGQRADLLAAGVDDWGGVSPLTPDHVNPERPWPQLNELAATTRAAGLELGERLTAHPRFVLDALTGSERWIDARLHPAVAALADPATGLARAGARPRGRGLQLRDAG